MIKLYPEKLHSILNSTYLKILFSFLLFLCHCTTVHDSNIIPIFLPTEIEECLQPTVHLLLGNPSCAKPNSSYRENFLMVKDQFVLSYNDSKRHANWVSWHLNEDWLGEIKRQNDFRADPDLPESFLRIDKSDYSHSGFDRGHICPSGDRTKTVEDNSTTFLMSNMIPQAPKNNRNTWRFLEEYERRLVNEGNELYIIAGSYGIGGEGKKGYLEKINEKINVPAHLWKILVVLPNGENDLSRIQSFTRIIAVDIPNVESVEKNSWNTYRVNVKSLEEKTGLNFFKNIPIDLQAILKSKIDSD